MNSLGGDEMIEIGTAHRSGQIGSLRCGGPYSNADEGNPGEPWNHEKSDLGTTDVCEVCVLSMWKCQIFQADSLVWV